MAWRIELGPTAEDGLAKLDPPVARGILKFLHQRVAPLEVPRSIGQALHGQRFGEFWKYRVGDYRIIAKIEDGRLCILLLRIGNWREVYR